MLLRYLTSLQQHVEQLWAGQLQDDTSSYVKTSVLKPVGDICFGLRCDKLFYLLVIRLTDRHDRSGESHVTEMTDYPEASRASGEITEFTESTPCVLVKEVPIASVAITFLPSIRVCVC